MKRLKRTAFAIIGLLLFYYGFLSMPIEGYQIRDKARSFNGTESSIDDLVDFLGKPYEVYDGSQFEAQFGLKRLFEIRSVDPKSIYFLWQRANVPYYSILAWEDCDSSKLNVIVKVH